VTSETHAVKLPVEAARPRSSWSSSPRAERSQLNSSRRGTAGMYRRPGLRRAHPPGAVLRARVPPLQSARRRHRLAGRRVATNDEDRGRRLGCAARAPPDAPLPRVGAGRGVSDGPRGPLSVERSAGPAAYAFGALRPDLRAASGRGGHRRHAVE
jgi:hypothetical protein